MRPLANLLTWLITLAGALTLVWLVQTYPAAVTIRGEGWQLTTSLAVAVLALVALLIAAAYGMLALHTFSRALAKMNKTIEDYELPWHRTYPKDSPLRAKEKEASPNDQKAPPAAHS